MPSFPHELPLALFRECPELVPHLLDKVLKIELPSYREVRIEASDLTQVTPTEYRADLVLTLYNDDDEPVMGIVVEVQLQIDRQKEYSWPEYVTGLRARLKCPVALLVFSDDEQVASWARQPIYIGARWWYSPIVLGPAEVPWVKTAEEAHRLPELAVLSALAHGNEPAGMEVLLSTIEALQALDSERKGFYYDVVLRSLNEAMRRALEQELQMQTRKYEYKSDFARTYFAQGRAEGEAEGRAEGEAKGRAEGEAKGEAKGRAEALLAVLTARGMALDASTRERIVSCTDSEQLQRWIMRAATASSLQEVLEVP